MLASFLPTTLVLSQFILDIHGIKDGRLPVAYRILKKIFRNYDRDVRPMNNFSQYLLVTINPVLTSIESVNEPQELITINYAMNLGWNDGHLKWNSSEMEGIEIIQIPSRRLWRPDVVIDSIIELVEVPPSEKVYCRLFYDGNVSCVFNQIVETHCQMEIRMFPFDRQNCTIIFYSWSYGADRVRLNTPSPETDLSYFKNNTEWDVVEYSNLIFLKQYVTASFSEVHYYLIMQRKPLYYLLTLVLPSYLVTTLALTGLFVPLNATGDREEKVSMGLNALLAMVVMLLLVSEQMPKTSNNQPMLGLYLIAQTVLVSIATSFTVIVLHFHRCALHGTPVPRWLLKITFPSCGPQKKDKCSSPVRFGSSKNDQKLLLKNLQGLNDLFKQNLSSTRNECLEGLLQQCLRQVISIRAALDEKQAENHLYTTWIGVCDRLDKILMILFNILNLIFTFVVFASGGFVLY